MATYIKIYLYCGLGTYLTVTFRQWIVITNILKKAEKKWNQEKATGVRTSVLADSSSSESVERLGFFHFILFSTGHVNEAFSWARETSS